MLQKTEYITTIIISENSHVMAFNEFKTDNIYNPNKQYSLLFDYCDYRGFHFDIFEVID